MKRIMTIQDICSVGKCSGKDVYDSGTCYCVWCKRQCGLWFDLLDYHIVLTRKAWPIRLAKPFKFGMIYA